MQTRLASMGVVLCCFAFLLAVLPAYGQTATTGQITGVVKDPTGAVVAGAKLILTSEAGTKRETESDSAGRYLFPLLEPGVYRLEVSKAGFKTVILDGIRVRVTESSTVDASMSLGAVVETVTVTAAVPLLQDDSPTTGRVIEEMTIRQLPLPTRNFQQLLALSPGTIADVPNNTEVGRGDTTIYVSGQRATSNNVILNGVEINSPGTNSTPNIAVPATDTIQEFIVQTSLYDATQGRNSGGNVAAVTKSGTNDVHGNIYWFHRNRVLNANDFFLRGQGQRKPQLLKNQFGFTLGGPIAKDRTFFFTSYQGTRERNGASLTNSITRVFLPNGLTDTNRTAAQLATTFGVPFVHPISEALLNARLPNGQFAIPSPLAISGPAGTPVATTLSAPSTFREDQFNANLDHELFEGNTLSAKFFFSNTPSFQGLFTFVGANANQLPGFGGDLTIRNRVVSLTDTHLFSSNLINEARFGYSRILAQSAPEEPFTAAQFGISNPLSSLFPGMPTIQVVGQFTIGSTGFADSRTAVNTFQVSDMLSLTWGRHFLRTGFQFRRYQTNLTFPFFSRGFISFSNFNAFLLGVPAFSILGSGDPGRGIRATDFAYFVQDDIKVGPRLTLNLGLRYEFFGGLSEVRGRFINFIPGDFAAGAPPNGLVQPCNANPPIPDVPCRGDTLNPDDHTFAPRVGFALRPFAYDRLVLRGGIGVFFDRFSTRMANFQLFNYPYGLEAFGVTVPAFGLFLPFATPFPNLPLPTAFPIVPADIPSSTIATRVGPLLLPPTPISGTWVDPNLKVPYATHYTLGWQWEFARNWLLEASYVGTKGTNLLWVATLNQLDTLNQILGISPPPFPGLSTSKVLTLGAQQVQSRSDSHYNSLQLSVTKRFSHGLQFLASYTLSKSIDEFSALPTNEIVLLAGDQQDPEHHRGRSDFDRRHRFIYSFVYDLPQFYKGESGAAKRLLNDWELAGIVTLQSGRPFTFVQSSAFPSVLQRPDLVQGQEVCLSGSVKDRLSQFFNTAALTPSALGAPFGTVGRNICSGPDQRNFDFSIIKFIPINERYRAEFRAEFFNIFNNVNFANPASDIFVPATFGRITGTSSGPRVIQFALKFSF